MDTVENILHRPPVIIGIGTRPQEAALRTAGARRVLIHPDQTAAILDLAGVSLRAGDILLMAQPGILKADEYRELYDACEGQLQFQVIGRPVFPISTRRHFAEFRKIKPKGLPETEALQLTGRPRTVNYTLEQAEAIIRLWHEKPKRTPVEIAGLTKTLLDLPEDFDLKPTWPRDLVIKFAGTAQRDRPEGWAGINKE